MLSLLSVNQSMYQSINLSSSQSHTHVDVKQRFLRFFVLVTFTFFIFQTFFYFLKKTLAKFRAASRLTRSTFKITATK